MSIFDLFKKTNSSIVAKGDSKIVSEANRLAKNAIRLNPQTDGGTLRPDCCKIGGKPYLPPDFVWPLFTGGDEPATRPLSFLCQINLEQVKEYDHDHVLPERGMLSFFYECESFCWGFDPEDKGAARVFYFENTDGFLPFDTPEELAEEYTMPEISLSFQAEASYPMYEELEIHSDLDCEWEEYDQALSTMGVDTENDPEGHKLLGYADIIQNEMLSECEQVTRGLYSGDPESYRKISAEEAADIQQKAKDWILLLELGTIETDDFEWMFGDCGMLYYYIRKEDLAAKRFDKVWFSLQCG